MLVFGKGISELRLAILLRPYAALSGCVGGRMLWLMTAYVLVAAAIDTMGSVEDQTNPQNPAPPPGVLVTCPQGGAESGGESGE